jgi:LPS sulfotransferase NodH
VCATARSGSNFLTDGLHATRKAGRPKQFFLPKFEGDYGAAHGLDSQKDFAGYVRGIIPATTTSNEVFGFKVMGWYLHEFLERLRAAFPGNHDDKSLLSSIFPRLKYLRMVRRNKLRQAISKARAIQSGLWKIQEGNAAHAEPIFDFDLIARCLKETTEDEVVWQRFYDKNGLVPHTVIYEDLCENYDVTIRSTLGFLGVKIPKASQLQPVTVRQADCLSEEWEKQFLKLAPTNQPL